MKTKIVIAAGLGVLSFLLGLGAMYAMMPDVDPDTVGRTKLQLDSLGLITVAQRDSLVRYFALKDSLAGDTLPPPVEEPAAGEPEALIADSLTAAGRRITALTQERDDLLERLATLEARLEDAGAARAEAENLSGTLAKLEQRQLSAILQNIGLDVLKILYEKASDRNRAKLLQAMPPERATRFIHALVGAPPPPQPEPPAEDGPDEAAKTEAAPR